MSSTLELSQHLQEGWKALRGRTYDLLDVLKQEDLEKKLPFPTSQSLYYQFECMIGTTETLGDAIKTGKPQQCQLRGRPSMLRRGFTRRPGECSQPGELFTDPSEPTAHSQVIRLRMGRKRLWLLQRRLTISALLMAVWARRTVVIKPAECQPGSRLHTNPEKRSFTYASFACSSRLDARKRTHAFRSCQMGPSSHTQ